MQQLRALAPPPPAPLTEEQPAWGSEAWAPSSSTDATRRIFCNRSLNMAHIKAIGFDMDYTLAQYRPETFEVLAYNLTVDKLVDVFGYPPVLREWHFDWQFMVRGLIIDKKRGNMLKVDRHKYVKLAFHGFTPLSREQRLATYAESKEQFEFDEPDFALIDTLFSLAEAHLFMQLVTLHDADPGAIPGSKQLPDMYRDVRAAVDRCHRDGSLKKAVAADPAKYIHEDGSLGALLGTLRQSGKKVFLATNSLWDYTSVVMNFLLSKRTGQARNTDWLKYFDVVITGCGKPAFFTVKNPLFEILPESGLLRNTDGGTPMIPIGEADMPSDLPPLPSGDPTALPGGPGQPAGVFQGGSTTDLHKLLGVQAGAQVLYVGDHIYGDILRSKKTLGWRTMLVVPELATELGILARNAHTTRKLRALRQQRDALEDQIQRLVWSLQYGSCTRGDEDAQQQSRQLERLQVARDEVRESHRAMLAEHHESFHTTWGQLLKTGYQNSRFAHQAERFACLYTSHVANLALYSPYKCYRGRMDSLAHEEEPVFGGGLPSSLDP